MSTRDGTRRHLTATGGDVTISLPAFDLARPATSHAIGLVDDDRQEFVTGNRRFARWAAERVAGLELDLRYSFRRGRLLAGSARARGVPDQRHSALVWIGRRWSLYMFHPNAAPATLIEMLSLVDLAEEGRGLALVAPQRDLQWEAPAQLTKVVPRLGLLDVAPMHDRVRRQLPRWAGTKARGGDLYVDRSNRDQTVYTIANPSSATRLLPQRGAARATLQRGLGRLRVAARDRTRQADGRGRGR